MVPAPFVTSHRVTRHHIKTQKYIWKRTRCKNGDISQELIVGQETTLHFKDRIFWTKGRYFFYYSSKESCGCFARGALL